MTIESAPVPAGCPACGVAAQVHSRRVVRLVDAPCFDTPQENLTDKQRARIAPAFAAGEAHGEVDLAWQGAQELRSAYRHPDKETGRTIAERIINSFPTCPVPEIARLGRTLRAWKEAFLAYFDTTATNGGTEAINVLIELHRRIDRGLTNFENYRLRMLLIGGGLNL
nr:transposase [Ornithinimicrobium sp. INDO-MA30-4]